MIRVQMRSRVCRSRALGHTDDLRIAACRRCRGEPAKMPGCDRMCAVGPRIGPGRERCPARFDSVPLASWPAASSRFPIRPRGWNDCAHEEPQVFWPGARVPVPTCQTSRMALFQRVADTRSRRVNKNRSGSRASDSSARSALATYTRRYRSSRWYGRSHHGVSRQILQR